MARTVNEAFSEFMLKTVNVDKGMAEIACHSRDWLIDRIHSFNSIPDFPLLANRFDLNFGSFNRNTKIIEIDDIDIIIGLDGSNAHYEEYGENIQILVYQNNRLLLNLCHDFSNSLHSIKVLNKFTSNLNRIPQYQKSEINRKQEAVVLNLSSYPWSFDIVPGFYTKPDQFGREYYLIPDGKGFWKKTDPRIDHRRLLTTNLRNKGYIFNIVKLMKYWNKRPTMPSMPQYLLECMILDYYTYQKSTKYLDLDVRNCLFYLSTAIKNTVMDPKGIQGDLNTISSEDKLKISVRATVDCVRAQEAYDYESSFDIYHAIKKWREIFGNEFPVYS